MKQRKPARIEGQTALTSLKKQNSGPGEVWLREEAVGGERQVIKNNLPPSKFPPGQPLDKPRARPQEAKPQGICPDLVAVKQVNIQLPTINASGMSSEAS